MNTLELMPSGSTGSEAITCAWPAEPGNSDEVQTEVGWSMSELGPAAAPAKDFLRIVAAAYLADRTVSRPQLAMLRDLCIVVHVEQPEAWTVQMLDRVADLLHWLSGDTWRITLVQADPGPEHIRPDAPVEPAEAVSLLSGGLDSLCGAILQLDHPATTVFLGHRDSSTSIRRAQETVRAALVARQPDFTYLRYAFRPLLPRRESTPRTRSLLFQAMATVLASGRRAIRILVPENGFTSINPPLEPSRGGPLTTRSTHPWTFRLVQQILDALPLAGMTIANPHATMTKGDLVAAALRPGAAGDLAVAAATVSCAKQNAGRLPGANPNLNCGLCIACMIRRGAFAAAGRTDHTRYLATTLTGASLERLKYLRRHDIAATTYATSAGLDEHRIVASGLWPPHTDFDAVLDLCDRGLEELSLVNI
ncbi:7-cyano-7-deazaguanine synthase [Actinoplanes sp. NPDC026623]|uniref:7-cyano-7-deazaguanine synthase n=1 Tax=Actinoplanes sp. NPDC026623 TaxID=3155610 RepID=UPI0033ED1D5F